MRSIIRVFIVSVLLLSPFYLSAQERQNVSIGVIVPLSGPTAIYGEPPKKLYQILEKRFNSDSSRFSYQFIYEDGKCGAGNAAVVAAKKLIFVDKVRVIITACSGETLQVAPVAEQSNTIVIAIASGHPDVKSAGPHIYRTYIDLEGGVKKISAAIRRDGRQRLAILSETTSFTESIADTFAKVIPELIVSSEEFSSGETDFRALIGRAKLKHPDAYYLNVSNPSLYQILLRQLRETERSVPIYAYFNPGEASSLKNLGTLQNEVTYFDVPTIRSHNSLFNRAVEELKSQSDSASAFSNFLLQTAFDAAIVAFSAIEKVGVDVPMIKKEIDSGKFEGATGRVSFDNNGDSIGLQFVLSRIRDGQPQLIDQAE